LPRSMMRAAGAWILAAALAAGLSGIAAAHAATFDTSLTLRRSPTGTVAPGTTVVFKGRLLSDNDRCVRNSRIQLILVGQGVVAKTRTDGRGRYSFEQVVNETSRWRTRFKGKVLTAEHPHNHTCASSRSDVVRVRVA